MLLVSVSHSLLEILSSSLDLVLLAPFSLSQDEGRTAASQGHCRRLWWEALFTGAASRGRLEEGTTFNHTVKPSTREDQLLHSPRLSNTRSIPEEIKEGIEKFPTYGFSFNRQSTRLLQKLISKSILVCRQTNSCSWTDQLLSSADL